MCDLCGKPWIEIPSTYPNGPCPNEWNCPDCGEWVSPCCGAKIEDITCTSDCDICAYCGSAACTECNQHCHCGGCV